MTLPYSLCDCIHRIRRTMVPITISLKYRQNIQAPSSWRNKAVQQLPSYPEQEKRQQTEQYLADQPPLVFAGKARALRNDLAKVARGEAFLLQGGDCVVNFEEFRTRHIRDTFKALMKMVVVLTFSGQKPVVKIGHIAGQFAQLGSQGDGKYRSFFFSGVLKVQQLGSLKDFPKQ